MLSVSLLIPILVGYVSDVFKPECTLFRKGDLLDDFRTGDYCNRSVGPTIIISQGKDIFALSATGHKLAVSNRDLVVILKTKIGTDLCNVTFYGTPTMIFIKFVESLDAINAIRSKYIFNHMLEDSDGCYRNGFFAFHKDDILVLNSYPYSINATFGNILGSSNPLVIQNTTSRQKRSLTCEGGGLGVGYGVGVTVVGVLVKTWCDTTDLEFSISEKYNKKFDQLASSQKTQIEQIEGQYKEESGAIDNLKESGIKLSENLKVHSEQMNILKQDLDNMQEWFNRENEQISYKVNWMGSHLNYELSMTQVNIFYDSVYTKITLGLNLWAMNAREKSCQRYDQQNPGNTVRFEHLLGIKQLTIENIDLRGKLVHIFEFLRQTNEVQQDLSTLSQKNLVVENGILKTSEQGNIGTMESMSKLIGLDQEALHHLTLNSTPWKRTVKSILHVLGCSMMFFGALFIFLNLHQKFYKLHLVIRQNEFVHFIVFFSLGVLLLIECIVDFI